MPRLVLAAAIELVANAIGLIVAAVILDDMTLSLGAFFLDVIVFTILEFVAQPIVRVAPITRLSVMVGASALVASFVALVLTTWLSDGLQISGARTWIFATVILWGAALLGTLLLPKLVFRTESRDSSATLP